MTLSEAKSRVAHTFLEAVAEATEKRLTGTETEEMFNKATQPVRSRANDTLGRDSADDHVEEANRMFRKILRSQDRIVGAMNEEERSPEERTGLSDAYQVMADLREQFQEEVSRPEL